MLGINSVSRTLKSFTSCASAPGIGGVLKAMSDLSLIYLFSVEVN